MMAVLNNELYLTWAMRLSVLTSIIVVLLSWINGVRFFELMIRAGVSFGVMYFLMAGSLSLFERTALEEPQADQLELDSSRGGTIDFSVGDDDEPLIVQKPEKPEMPEKPEKSEKTEVSFPGQIDGDLSSGLPDGERQAEIVRRMGWD